MSVEVLALLDIRNRHPMRGDRPLIPLPAPRACSFWGGGCGGTIWPWFFLLLTLRVDVAAGCGCQALVDTWNPGWGANPQERCAEWVTSAEWGALSQGSVQTACSLNTVNGVSDWASGECSKTCCSAIAPNCPGEGGFQCCLASSWMVRDLQFDLNAVSAPNGLGSIQLDSHMINNAGSTASVTQSGEFSKEVTRSFSFELSEESKITVGIEATVTASTSVQVESPKIPFIGGGASGTSSVEATVGAFASTEFGTSYTLGKSIDETETKTSTWEQNVPGCTVIKVNFMASQGTATVPFTATMAPTDSSITGCEYSVTGTWTGASVSNTNLQTEEVVDPPLSGACASNGDTSSSASLSPSNAGATPESATPPSRDELPIGAIIGGGLGAVAILAAAAVTIAWIKIKKAKVPARTGPAVVTGIPATTEMTPSKV